MLNFISKDLLLSEPEYNEDIQKAEIALVKLSHR